MSVGIRLALVRIKFSNTNIRKTEGMILALVRIVSIRPALVNRDNNSSDPGVSL
ncbi:MAG: hypothetical protein IPM04_01525 [Saprospiraceae bacterium]|nr:hypothetical protein [Candidatus Brachybacter algidus]